MRSMPATRCVFFQGLPGAAPFPALLAACIALVAIVLGACSSKDPDQGSPEATIASARAFVEAGTPERLPDLVYADTPEMRRLLNTAGRLLGNVDELAREVSATFPHEVAQIRERAAEDAKAGKASSLIGQLAQTASRQRGRRGPPRREDRSAIDDASTRFLADPFAFLKEAEGKITTAYVDEETVAILWDGKPALAPIGLVMRRGEDEKWYFMLPTNIPSVAQFMPQTPEQYKIMGAMVATLDKTVVDLRAEVRSGRLTSPDAVARRAGEITFMPAVLIFAAYQSLREKQAAGG